MDRGNYWTRKALSRRHVLAASGAAAGAALVGCGDDDGDTKPATAAPQVGATPTPISTSAAATAAPAVKPDANKLSEKEFLAAIPSLPAKDWKDADIKTGGRMVRLFRGESSFDMQVQAQLASPGEEVNPVYNRLIRLACHQGIKNPWASETEGDLATAWERPDPQTIVLTLAQNVKWQNVAPLNGRPFTVDDVRYSFERGKAYTKGLYKSYFSQFKAVEDVGGGKIKITTEGPAPAMEAILASTFMHIMPKEIGDDPQLAATKLVGTGPMILDKHTPNVEFVYKKNPDYFKKDAAGRPRPYVDELVLRVINDQAARTATFEGKQADSTYQAAQVVTIDDVYGFAKRQPDVVIQSLISTQPAITWVYRIKEAPFNDPRVRQAFSLLLDRKTISDTLIKGLGLAAPYLPWPFLFDKPPTLQDAGPNYAYDPKKAKDLLTAAGVTNLELDLHYYGVSQLSEDINILYQQAVAPLGIKINLQKAPDSAGHNAKVTNKSWKGMLMNVRGTLFLDPEWNMGTLLPGSGANIAEIDDAKLTQLAAKQKGLLGNDRKAALKEIWDYELEQMFEITQPAGPFINTWWPWMKNHVDASWRAFSGNGAGNIDNLWMAAKS